MVYTVWPLEQAILPGSRLQMRLAFRSMRPEWIHNRPIAFTVLGKATLSTTTRCHSPALPFHLEAQDLYKWSVWLLSEERKELPFLSFFCVE